MGSLAPNPLSKTNDKWTVAQRTEMTEDERLLTSCVCRVPTLCLDGISPLWQADKTAKSPFSTGAYLASVSDMALDANATGAPPWRRSAPSPCSDVSTERAAGFTGSHICCTGEFVRSAFKLLVDVSPGPDNALGRMGGGVVFTELVQVVAWPFQ